MDPLTKKPWHSPGLFLCPTFQDFDHVDLTVAGMLRDRSDHVVIVQTHSIEAL